MNAPTFAPPFLLAHLADVGEAMRVIRGHVDVFAVRLGAEGAPEGRRRHVCRREGGAALFAVTPQAAQRTGLLAVCSADAELAPLAPAALAPTAYAALVDDWVEALGAGAFGGSPPKDALQVEPGATQEIPGGTALCARSGVVWVTLEAGGGTVMGAVELPAGSGPWPLAGRVWAEAGPAPTRFAAAATVDRVTGPDFEDALQAYHALVLAALAAEEARSVDVERARADRRAQNARHALHEGTWRLASILEPGEAAADVVSDDPLLMAARRVGRALGVEVRAPEADAREDGRDQAGAIARASRLRTRKVLLSGDWWRHDIGPTLAMKAPDEEGGDHRPVALIPRGSRLVLLDGPDAVPVTEAVAERLHPVALTFYRPFPDRALTALDVLRFGLWGGRRDLWIVFGTGLLIVLLGLLTPYATGELFQTAIPEADRGLVAQLIGALVAAALGTAAFYATRGFALLRLESRMDVTIQAAVWDRLLKLPTGFFRAFTAGELATRAGAISTIRQLLSGATITSLLGGLFSLVYVGLMLWYSRTLTLWALGLTGVALAITLLVSYVQLRHQRRSYEIQSRLQGRVLQFLTGLTKLRVAGAEATAFAHWADEFGAQRRLQVRARRTANGLATFNAAFPVLSSLVLFAVVVEDGRPILPIGAFVAFHAAYGTFSTAVLSLSSAFTAALSAIPLYEQARPILSAVPEVDPTKVDPGELTGRLAVDHVTFRYDPDGPPVLQDVTIRAEPGEFVALVGPSGSGKSTVLRLLLGFETPEAGAVMYDDHDLGDVDVQAVRRQLGVVLQSGGVLQGNIFNNIVGSTNATHDDAWRAARMAGLDRDIRAMPMGMHTVLSEGGTTLSGGQRQRLLIARAVVNRPRILLFDEATSALDNQTQAIVSRSLEALVATRVVVAHRLSTIQHADRIYVLDKGRVVQVGTYDELLRQPGLFAELASRQLT